MNKPDDLTLQERAKGLRLGLMGCVRVCLSVLVVKYVRTSYSQLAPAALTSCVLVNDAGGDCLVWLSI